ncbi:MAG: DJ-1/PfpI family protein [Nocardioidaceae bacterium]|nr:DJ-1/PfpI family protein [Nocardioidaceae bacterium]
MRTAILIYEGFTSLDATGPFEVLSRLPEADVVFVSPDGGTVVADQPRFALPTVPLAEVTAPVVVVVAGGSTTQRFLEDEELLGWLRAAHETTRFTTSVCTGSLLLGAAGLLQGLPATSHWCELDSLAVFGATPTSERVVVHDRIITSAGVSSGIDMALVLADRLESPEYSQGIQLAIEYDPQPPHDAGSMEKAPEAVAAVVRAVFDEHYGPSWAQRVADRS